MKNGILYCAKILSMCRSYAPMSEHITPISPNLYPPPRTSDIIFSAATSVSAPGFAAEKTFTSPHFPSNFFGGKRYRFSSKYARSGELKCAPSIFLIFALAGMLSRSKRRVSAVGIKRVGFLSPVSQHRVTVRLFACFSSSRIRAISCGTKVENSSKNMCFSE